MTKVIGIKDSCGKFTSKEGKEINYDNLVLYVITDSDPNVLGMTSSEIKIKKSNFEKITGLAVGSYSDLIDKQVTLSFVLIKDKPILEKITILK